MNQQSNELSSHVRESVKKKVSKLKGNEFFVIFYHFWGRMSLWDISEKLKLSYSETDYIYESTLKKLKNEFTHELAEIASNKL